MENKIEENIIEENKIEENKIEEPIIKRKRGRPPNPNKKIKIRGPVGRPPKYDGKKASEYRKVIYAERVQCNCGSSYSRYHKSRHLKTMKHLKYREQFIINFDTFEPQINEFKIENQIENQTI